MKNKNIGNINFENQPNKVKETNKYWQILVGIIPASIKNALYKFYANKKIFLPILIATSLLILTVVVGLIFGDIKKTTNTSKSGNLPMPTVVATPKTTEQIDTITTIENKLKNLRSETGSLDVRQNKIQPPEIDFEVRF